MTLIEILKAKGVSDELIQAIQADMKSNNVYTASEENLDIRYGKLKTQHESTAKQLEEANGLIETLKKSTKGQEDAQQKISAYEQQVTQLQAELEQTKLESAIKVELLAAKAIDVDYLAFKLKEKGELALDEQGKIKGWDDKLAGLKTQFPTQFEAEGKKNIIENKLPNTGGNDEGISKEAFAKMGYQERLKVYQENPEAYKQLTQN
jgi:hypothetical protein